jgi:preprotein translocase subunit SecE
MRRRGRYPPLGSVSRTVKILAVVLCRNLQMEARRVVWWSRKQAQKGAYLSVRINITIVLLSRWACWDSGFSSGLGCDSSFGWTDSF